MKLTFLGTAAAEGVPAVFCNCPTCKRAKERGGKDVRTRSQILIDGDTLFDFPMDTYLHMLRYKLDLSAIRRVLITHAHMDHCYPMEFCMRGGPFAHEMTEPVVKVFCNQTVAEIFENDTSREMRSEVQSGIEVRVLHPFDEVIDGDMKIIPLPASHTKGEECLVYYVERDGIGVLFLNDTGVIDKSVFQRLYKMGGRVNAATFDCTYGAIRHGAGRHMGLYDVEDMTEIIKSSGVAAKNVKFIATHFSHNTDLDYEGIKSLADKIGITVAYDGMIQSICGGAAD